MIIKSANGSGDAHGNRISGISFEGDGTTPGTLILQAIDAKNTYDNIVSDLTGYYPETPSVWAALVHLTSDGGGNVYGNQIHHVSGSNLGAGVYIDRPTGAGAMTNNMLDHFSLWVTSDSGFTNSGPAGAATLTDFVVNGVSLPTAGTAIFGSPASLGLSVWNGNPTTPQIAIAAADPNVAQITIQFPDGAGNLHGVVLQFGNSVANGSPGIGIGMSTTATARYLQDMSDQKGSFSNSGEARWKKYYVKPPSGAEGIRITPESDSDIGDIAIGCTNAAEDTWKWSITKHGQLTNVKFPISDAGLESGSWWDNAGTLTKVP